MFPTPDYSALRAALLRDISNQLPDAAVGADSDFAIRANAVAAAIEGLYQHQQWIVRQMLPDTADADYLERWAGLYSIVRKAAVAASGSITFALTSGGLIPAGTEAKSADGTAFVTTAAGSLAAAGALTLAAVAVLPGAAGNLAASSALTLSAAPAGVANLASLVIAMAGGADSESDAALLARLLSRLRRPPHGGNAADYLSWAQAVAGVAEAYVYPMRRGLGTVDVVIEGVGGGLPSAQLISATQAAINLVKPVTANCLVLAAVHIPVAVTAVLSLNSGTLAQASAVINTGLTAYFAQLKPGDSVIKSRLAAIIADAPGVLDFNLTAPIANVNTQVTANAVELPILGAVNLS
jgi:uncharacterized phage protein gp47/JayE